MKRVLIRAAILLIPALAAGSSAWPQGSPMDGAAAQIAHALAQAKQKSVMVFDFTGPGAEVTALGRRLADEFNAGLKASAPQLRAESRAPTDIRNKAGYYVPELVLDPEATIVLARDLNVRAFVTGELSIEHDKLVVKVSSYASTGGRGIKAMQVSWPMTPETKDLLDDTLVEAMPPKGGMTNEPRSPATGHKPPACGYCPRANYTTAATDAKLQGVVELESIIDEHGIVQDLWVIKSLPDGLTAMATTTVARWKLVPATGPDGNPETVRQIIEVTFQLY